MNFNKKVLVIAHRGASNIAPENTLKAFKKAIELKADYIEFDVHQSKDGEIVIFHDDYVSHMNGQKKFIKDMILKEIKTLDIGEGEKIPTLKELIKIAKGNIGLQCEVKAPNFSKNLIEILKQNNLIETSILSSFMFNELLELQKLDPNLKLGLLVPSVITSSRKLIKYSQKAIKNNFYSIHPYFKSINEEFIKLAHDNNMMVNVWTVNKESDIRRVLKMGVDGIISDNVELIKRLLIEI
ncbi:MAG: glycerophosphodiester phosphodiesterase [Candidatus Hermodarchaeota archaeon]